ncbi:MAG: DUF4124 domain-containing protein [Gammaproteobacteria bacterium]
MNKIAQLTAALAVYLAAGVVLASGVYKWVDDKGVTHYTDRPPMSKAVEEVDIQVSVTAGENAAENASDETAPAATTDEIQASNEQTMAANAEIRKENCQRATERQQRYSTARKLYKTLPNGEREYLNSDELDAERADATAIVNKWCDG